MHLSARAITREPFHIGIDPLAHGFQTVFMLRNTREIVGAIGNQDLVGTKSANIFERIGVEHIPTDSLVNPVPTKPLAQNNRKIERRMKDLHSLCDGITQIQRTDSLGGNRGANARYIDVVNNNARTIRKIDADADRSRSTDDMAYPAVMALIGLAKRGGKNPVLVDIEYTVATTIRTRLIRKRKALLDQD